jgi:hypothetical protein
MSTCSYRIREAWGVDRYCRQSAKWFVEFTTPDDGKTMRKRDAAIRCTHHRAEKFLPKGATQVTTRSLGWQVDRDGIRPEPSQSAVQDLSRPAVSETEDRSDV